MLPGGGCPGAGPVAAGVGTSPWAGTAAGRAGQGSADRGDRKKDRILHSAGASCAAGSGAKKP